MNNTRSRYVNWLQVGAILGTLLLVMPLLIAAAFVSRFVLLFVVLSALVVVGAAAPLSPRFRAWLSELGDPETHYKGLRLATDVAVSPVHAWVRGDGDGVEVGTDDLAPTVLGPVSMVELPTVGRWFQRGEPIAHLRRGDRSVPVRAPVSGVVTGRNEALRLRPELVNDAPYSDGWIARLRGDGHSDDRSWLQRGRRARAWFRNEIDRLVPALLGQEGMTRVAADGGQLVGQVYRQIDDATWQRICAGFFACRTDTGAAGAPAGAAQPRTEEK